MTDYGQIGHKDNDSFIVFVCYVAAKMRPLPRHMWRDAFNSLTAGRDDAKEIKAEVWKRLK